MNVPQKTILPVFIILALNYAFSDGNCNEEKASLAVVGVFDFNDSPSVKAFEDAISRHNSLRREECVPSLNYRVILVKKDMSVHELLTLADSALLDGPCLMVYASEDSKAKIVLDIATRQGLNIITAIPEYRPYDQGINYNYDPVSVASMNRIRSTETKISALLALLHNLKWRKFVAVTGSDHESTSLVNSLEGHLRVRNVEILDWFVFTPNTTALEMYHRFQTLTNDAVTFLLITNNLTMSHNAFSVAAGRTQSWIVLSDLDVKTFIYSQFPQDVYSLTPTTTQEITLSSFVDDTVRAIGLSLVERPISVVSSCTKMSEMRRLLSEVTFHGASGPVTLDSLGNRVPLGYDVYKIEQNEEEYPPTKIDQLGYWHNGKLFITHQSDLPKLKILMNEYPPNVMTQPKIRGEPCQGSSMPCMKSVSTPDGEKKMEFCCYGFVIDVLEVVMGEYPFIPELLFTLDGQYGVYDEANDTWNGVVAELLSGRGDVSFDLYISSRRATVVEFTEPYMPSGIRLLVKESEREESDIVWLSYLRPFTPPVWLTLLGTLGVMIFFLWVMDKVSPVRGSNKLFNRNSPFKIDNAICFALSLAFGRPADESKPTTNGARLSSVAFGMAMLVFVSTYSANLAAFLIVDDKTTPVEDIYDLKIERPPEGFKYGTIDGSYMADYFKNSENAYFRHTWYHMKSNNVKSLLEGVQAVRTGKLDVFIADHVGLEYESMNDPYCEFKVVGEPFAMSGASVAVKKGHKLFKPLSEALQRIKAKGLTDYIQKFWVSKYSCKRDIPPAQLKMEDLSGLFLQLTIAMVACILGTACHRTFLYARERWTQIKTDDSDDRDLRCGFSHIETLV